MTGMAGAEGAHGVVHNHTFDELQPGQRAELHRTLAMDDIKAFAAVSGDVNPAHLDAAWAETTRFHGVIAHGMWAGALVSSLLGTEFPGAGTIYLEQNLRFHRPVRVGDALVVSVTVLDKDPATRNVRLDCAVVNQVGEQVVSGQALVKAPSQKISRPRLAAPTLHLFDPEARLAAWVAAQRPAQPARCAVVHPCDASSLRAAVQAAAAGLVQPVLLGPAARLQALADSLELTLAGCTLVDQPHSHAAAQAAVALAARGEVDLLCKGSLSTEELMLAVLAEPALATGRRLSHVARFEVPAYGRPLLVTDAAVNIRPDLAAKADILRNAIDLAQALGVACPRVAVLSAVETVTPRIASTLDAAALCKMADRGQIRGAVVDGPLAFDNAISMEAAGLKDLHGPVAGQADVLLAPDLEAGHLLSQQLEYLAGAASCGVVLGARVPVALALRTGAASALLASMALAGRALAASTSGG
ncbi:bifunctional enoyl-CoA hydratase/phosphate acetyltransferase [Ideonella livida]|uniref:Bifunctional enoyl-CoA hydratase/phosphate acetyltransferase n=1 Tax=Ideonella livida TaxID=2707176 RepID=A0A7C9TNX6_9BURK|nr:bifunctional enoyl-CoA hydratase/phosphate acetyltransferase [Ideonella livida]NDY92966.1 bifunctional enoyl-CoA hydratase/phosphate acetyltransferase [Ideonella livida]